jgi:acyl-CoA thioesterase-1
MTTFRARLVLLAALLAVTFGRAGTARAEIVALGASNVAGRGVSSSEAFPAQLERMLSGKGYNVHVANTFNARRLGQGDQKAEFASIVARLRSRGIKIIPVTGSGIGRNYLQADGIHLTAEGHARLATQLLPSVIRALGH